VLSEKLRNLALKLENRGSRIDMQTLAGDGSRYHRVMQYRPRSLVAMQLCGFVTVWPWPLTFWPVGQYMPSDYYTVYVYQVWCW